jgi:hypothetical protein
VFPCGESGKDQLAASFQASAYEIEALASVVDTKATILRGSHEGENQSP